MIAFDLDGTLAHYDGWKGVDHIGEPIPKMIDKLKRHLEQGDECVIFTARVTGEHDDPNDSIHHIAKWLRKHRIPPLGITCIKSSKFTIMYDDRAFRIAKNEGVIV